MEISTHDTVGEIVARLPRAAEVFEDLRIDYCCRGARRLAEACAEQGLAPDAVVARLTAAAETRDPAFIDWSQRDAAAIIGHLLETHHPYTRHALDRTETLMGKVIAAHGKAHPEVVPLASSVAALKVDLLPHLLREEQVLFPYIVAMHQRRGEGAALSPPPFGTVRNPVRMMNREHEAAGEILREIEARTGGFVAPAHACNTWRALYDALRELTRDLHRHIHLETEVLFPMAVALERG
jgi:regulator of cell morphogenesis and NO signaling